MSKSCTYRLCDDAFVRSYEDIGLAYHQATFRQKVFDRNGAAFLQQLRRHARSSEETVASLAAEFKTADTEALRLDFHDFSRQLQQDGFVEIGDNSGAARSWPPRSRRTAGPTVGDDCGVMETSAFLKAHFAKHPRIFSFQYSVTENCNEQCVHCYVDRMTATQLPLSRSLELIDELAETGTLDISFTGGEALSSPRLPRLIAHARQNDLVVSLLTNLTLLTDELRDVIRDANLQVVQTSLYSMDPQVHDSITRKTGSWRQTLAALETLAATGVRLDINCPVLRENLGTFDSVLAYGQASGIQVRCDIRVTAKEDGDRAVLDHRIASRDLDDALRTIILRSPDYARMLGTSERPSEPLPLEECGIGTYKLSMKSDGSVIPCAGFGRVVGNAHSRSLTDIWKNATELVALRNLSRPSAYPQCAACSARDYCAFCMARFSSEVGWTPGTIPDAFCDVARANKRVAEHLMTRREQPDN